MNFDQLALRIEKAMCELAEVLRARERIFDATLSALNAQLPFVGFQPSPAGAIMVFLAANVARDVPLLDRTQAVRFGYSASPLYASFQGRVSLPVAGNDVNNDRGIIVNPDGWYYAAGLRSVSLLAPADTIVSVHCHVQL